MNVKARRGGWLAACAILLLGGISESRTSSRATQEQPGNVGPEPSSACPDLPDGVPVIAGLKTAWAIAQPSSSPRLLFSDQALPCRVPKIQAGPPSEVCADSWQFGFTLPSELQAPGVHGLANYPVEFAESVTHSESNHGCGGGPSCSGVSTGTAGGALGPDGVVEIYAVTDECISGRILRLSGVTSSDYTGAFQAMRCEPTTD